MPHIQERMARYTEAEVRFNIMAITRDRLLVLQEKVEEAGQGGAGVCGICQELVQRGLLLPSKSRLLVLQEKVGGSCSLRLRQHSWSVACCCSANS